MDNENKPRKLEEPKDPSLDIPSVANEEKHINFLAEEEKDQESINQKGRENDSNEKRREEWQSGIEEGKKNREQPPSFQKRDLDDDEEY